MSSVLDYNSKLILATSDSFPLIMSHMSLKKTLAFKKMNSDPNELCGFQHQNVNSIAFFMQHLPWPPFTEMGLTFDSDNGMIWAKMHLKANKKPSL